MLFNSAPQVVKIRINPCNAINDQFKFKTTIPNNPTVNLYRLSNRDFCCKTDAKTGGKIQAETFQNPAKQLTFTVGVETSGETPRRLMNGWRWQGMKIVMILCPPWALIHKANVIQIQLGYFSEQLLSPYFQTFMEPRNQFQGMNSASLCSLTSRYGS